MKQDDQVEPEVPDGELVDRARAGDETAMNALVTRHHETVYRVALSITRDVDRAQDVAQDAFLKAFRGLDRFRGDAPFRSWLLTITSNEARTSLRRVRRRREQALHPGDDFVDTERNPAEAAVVAEEARRARDLLQSLPEKQRLAVTLRIEDGLSFRDIGELIGSTEGAARVNYFHGIRKLRELMS